MKLTRLIPLVAAASLLAGCPKKDEEKPENTEPLTAAEAQGALEEAAISSEVDNLTSGTIEIATDFTIGGAVEAAAQEIQTFVESQLPCAEISLVQNTLTVEYGVNPGNCTYKGQEYTGTHTMTVEKNDMAEVLVHHDWDEVSNGKVSVSGTADVTWSFSDITRTVSHELTWTRLSDGKTGVGTGERVQAPLNGDLTVGLSVDGFNTWTGDSGTWNFDIDEIAFKWSDPVPESGAYTLEAPSGKSISLSFERLDEDTITVTVESGGRSFSFNVSKLGAVSEA